MLNTPNQKKMKTAKPKIVTGFLLLLTTFPALFVSCSDEGIDLRDQITGQYNYTIKLYVQDGESLVYVGDEGDNYDITGTLQVSKSSQDHNVLDFFDGSDLMFQGIDVKDAGNTIVFNIPEQEAWVGPTKVQISGYKYWKVNSSSYDGAFIYSDKSIEIGFTARIMNAETGYLMIFTALRR
jgi:hypothetical protein